MRLCVSIRPSVKKNRPRVETRMYMANPYAWVSVVESIHVRSFPPRPETQP
jgi:hypothetical protein